MRFDRGDAYELAFADGAFDFVACRHVPTIPDAPRVLAELVRVLAPGGRLHVIAEDFRDDPRGLAAGRSREVLVRDAACVRPRDQRDLHVGRHVVGHLQQAARHRRRDALHVAVDTLRVPRATFAAIFEAWRDGMCRHFHEYVGAPEAELRAAFDATIDAIREPKGYALAHAGRHRTTRVENSPDRSCGRVVAMRVLVTGANRGIGHELVRQLVERGDDVDAVSQDAAEIVYEDKAADSPDRLFRCDIAGDASVRALAAELGDAAIPTS